MVRSPQNVPLMRSPRVWTLDLGCFGDFLQIAAPACLLESYDEAPETRRASGGASVLSCPVGPFTGVDVGTGNGA